MTSKEKCLLICSVLSSKKAGDIVYIDVASKSSLCDYFIVCSGRSTTQVKALAEYVSEKLEDAGVPTLRSDGVREGKWAVLDLGSVIVHIFNDDTRMFYCLEKLWADGDNVRFYPEKK